MKLSDCRKAIVTSKHATLLSELLAACAYADSITWACAALCITLAPRALVQACIEANNHPDAGRKASGSPKMRWLQELTPGPRQASCWCLPGTAPSWPAAQPAACACWRLLWLIRPMQKSQQRRPRLSRTCTRALLSKWWHLLTCACCTWIKAGPAGQSRPCRSMQQVHACLDTCAACNRSGPHLCAVLCPAHSL